eukprot:30088-Chlamydomonas_euryale.AAC.2
MDERYEHHDCMKSVNNVKTVVPASPLKAQKHVVLRVACDETIVPASPLKAQKHMVLHVACDEI